MAVFWKYVLCAFLMLAFSLNAYQDSKATEPPYQGPRVEGEISVDGRLDEPFWADAVRVEANVEVSPAENVPAPVETEALFAYTQTHLYVGVIASDPDPSQIRAHLSERDNIGVDDWIVVLFDTFNDQRRSYDFMVNPLGVQQDFIETTGGNGSDWDAIWYSAGRITDEGYVVEMSIPFSSFSFQHTEGDQIWGFDVVRSYPRSVRHHIGAFPRDRSNNCYLCQAPKLVGFAGVQPGRNIEIDPTFSTTYSQEREDLDEGGYGPMEEKDRRYDPGVTGKWNVTPNMTLSATVNPDFSQVEADAAQMDINIRFPLYYSEKRPFFTENSDMYNMGDLVHTRTLADPDWGIKLTGKAGRNTIGLFTVRDTVTPLMFPDAEGADNTTLSLQSQGTVFRYMRDLFESSAVGVLLTDREGTNYHNRVAFIVADLRFTKTDRIIVAMAGTTTRYPRDVAEEFDQKTGVFEGRGGQVGYNHDTEDYSVFGQYVELSPDVRTDLGFTTQVGFRSSQFGGQYRWRASGDNWYNWISINGSRNDERDWDDNPLHQYYQSDLSYQGPLQSSINVSGRYGHEYYEGEKYRANYVSVKSSLQPSGSTSMGVSVRTGDHIDFTNNRQGTLFRVSPGVEQKIGDRLSLSLSHQYNNLEVDVGRLHTANVSNGQVKYQFTRQATLRVILQHVHYDRVVNHYIEDEREDVDAKTQRVFSQVLFSYELNPRTVFYLGYSDNYQNRNPNDDPLLRDDIIQTNRAVFTKIGYAWQL